MEEHCASHLNHPSALDSFESSPKSGKPLSAETSPIRCTCSKDQAHPRECVPSSAIPNNLPEKGQKPEDSPSSTNLLSPSSPNSLELSPRKNAPLPMCLNLPPFFFSQDLPQQGLPPPPLGVSPQTPLFQAPHQFLLGEALAKGFSPRQCTGLSKNKEKHTEEQHNGDFSFSDLKPLATEETTLPSSMGDASSSGGPSNPDTPKPKLIPVQLQTPNHTSSDAEGFFTPRLTIGARRYDVSPKVSFLV